MSLLRAMMAACLLSLWGDAFGNVTDWNIGYTGNWTDLAAWDNGVPQSGDTANFDQTFDGNEVLLPTTSLPMAAVVNVAGIWNFEGGNLNAGSIYVSGQGASQFTTTSVTAGTFTTGVGYGAATFGSGSTLSVTGAGSALDIQGPVGLDMNSANLSVTNDTLIDGSGAEIQVTGRMTSDFGGSLTVGQAGAGTFLSYGFGSYKPLNMVGGDMGVATLANSSASVSLYDSTLTITGNLSFGKGGYTWTENNSSVTVDEDLSISGAVGSQVIVDQQSSLTVDGTLDLSGYLSVNGALNATGGLNLNPNGYLKGTGTFSGTIDNLGGTIQAGDGAGVLHLIGNYSANASSTTASLFDSGGASMMTVTGSASLNGLLMLDVHSGYVYRPDVWIDVLSAQGGVTGTFSRFSWSGGGDWLVRYGADDVYVEFATPEPSPFLGLGAGFALLGLRRVKSARWRMPTRRAVRREP